MKVLAAMSGGVDSAVAALFLKEQGHDVHGLYMKNWINEEDVLGHCPWKQDIEDASATAKAIGIPFEVQNFMHDYRERIVKYLVEGYAKGITPNPDVMCNREMKFGVLLDWALEQGFEAVATGHYCRKLPVPPEQLPDHTFTAVQPDAPLGNTCTKTAATHPNTPIQVNNEGHDYGLFTGVDNNKDQSYFLAMLQRPQLARACFPIGHLTKPQLREKARQADLPVADKKDSQGICFIGEVKINDFLKHFIPDSPGEIVSLDGRVLGQHRGLHRYTIGQRRGIGVPSNTDNEFFVVVAKRAQSNQLVVAFDHPDIPELYGREFRLHNLNWLTAAPLAKPATLSAKARYRDPSTPVDFEPQADGSATIIFHETQRAIAPGQVCALYLGERLLGGGIYY